MRAVNDRIITTRVSPEKGTPVQQPSGLYVVEKLEDHWDDFMELLVHSVGPEVREEISEGDVVITRGMAGADVTFEGEKYVVILEADALAVRAPDTD